MKPVGGVVGGEGMVRGRKDGEALRVRVWLFKQVLMLPNEHFVSGER